MSLILGGDTMAEDLDKKKHRLSRNQILNLTDPRYNATKWSEKYTFSKKSEYTGGKANLNFDEARDDPAFAGTNSGIYEISTVKPRSQKYSWEKSDVVNTGESGKDLVDRVKGKFTGTKKDEWNKLAKEFDLQIRMRSNQKKARGTSPHPHALEAIEFAQFKLEHGELPKMNSINAKKIKHIKGDPEPLTRAGILVKKWAKDNDFGLLWQEKISREISESVLKNFDEKEFIGTWVMTSWMMNKYLSFFSKGCHYKFGKTEETIMYEQFMFHFFDPENPEENNDTLYYADSQIKTDYHISLWPSKGFGKLQYQLGVLSAIAYLDHRSY